MSRDAEMRGAAPKITYTCTAERQVRGASSKYETLPYGGGPGLWSELLLLHH